MATVFSNPSDDKLYDILSNARIIAMVGASSNPSKPSYSIMQMLQAAGYRVIPVNPNESSVLGEKAYPTLLDVPDAIDIVNVFRRPEYTVSVAEEAVKVKAKTLWLQQGIYNEEAAQRAQAGGVAVIMDLCIAVIYSVLKRRFPKAGVGSAKAEVSSSKSSQG